ncbi:cuticle protein 21.3 isoform X2 [Sitodiplosis mosellana]|uniref:cuticle protein 21.3 isoform X2 n=1 Tax=Sitodiplosis mosellana TaxID=263140 RepID=UPI0024438090|nr:cuticle protein 21.3 isoform X2 [Sitodiplosis mosellana]
MAFKLVFLAAFVAYVQAGGPAAYSIAALSGDHAYVGSQQEHTVKGLYGQNVVSSYSKAVDSAHSSVRVSNSRQSNDVLGGYHAGYAAPAVVGGYGGYGGYGVSKVVSPVGAYAAPAVYGGAYAHGYNRVVSPVSTVVSHGYAAPTYAAPAYAAGYGVSKVVSPYGLAHAAPAVYGGYGGLGYASKVVAPVAPVSTVVSHGIAAPAYGYSKVVSPTYGVAHASPAVYGGYGAYGHGLGYSHGIAAPAYGYNKVVAPAVYGAHATPAVYGGYGAYGHGLGYGVSKVVSPVHSVAAPVYGGYGGYGAYGVSKVVSPVATLGLGHAPVVKTVAPAFTASVVSPGASYSW